MIQARQSPTAHSNSPNFGALMISATSNSVQRLFMVEDQLKKARQLERETKEPFSKIRNNGAEFLLHESATGLVFAQLAQDSEKRRQPKAAARQRNSALQAYQTVLKFLPEATPTPPQKRQIEADLAELESRLKALGVS